MCTKLSLLKQVGLKTGTSFLVEIKFFHHSFSSMYCFCFQLGNMAPFDLNYSMCVYCSLLMRSLP